MGGRFVEVSDESPLCLNFFTNIIVINKKVADEDKKIVHPHELTTIIPIIGSMLKMDLKSTHSENKSDDPGKKAIVTILEEAIQVAYERQGTAAGMQTVWEYLAEIKTRFEDDKNEHAAKIVELMIIALYDFVERDLGDGNIQQGRNYDMFNGVNNLDFDSDFFTFEMEKLTRRGEDIVEIVSMTVLHQIANEAYHVKGRRKLIGLDETARLLRKELFVDYIDDFSRRIRKYDGIFLLITQYIIDFFHNKSAQTIFDGASYKVLFEQEPESIDEAVDTGKLSIGDGKRELIKSVRAKTPDYNEFALLHDGQCSVILNKVDSFSYWLFTTKPKDKDKIFEMEQTYNLHDGEGAWMMALISVGFSEDKALNEIIEKRKIGA